MHSSYSLNERRKTTARGAQGLRVRFENIDAALLLDVADFICETALVCQELPLHLGVADSLSAADDTITYSLQGVVLARRHACSGASQHRAEAEAVGLATHRDAGAPEER